MLRLLASPRAAGVIGCLTLLLIGWSGLLVPSLIRSIELDFRQTDAGIGTFYLVWAIAYAVGSLGGGVVTERIGRRRILIAAALAHGLGLAIVALVPPWGVALVAAVPAGLGAGALDGGSNGLILDLYQAARGRALNTLHLFFSIGALSSPLVVGQLVDAGVAWQGIVIATAAAFVPLAGLYAVARLPHGRHVAAPREVGARRATPIAFTWPLLTLEVAIACYVAAEIGVSNWLVRFLDTVPLGTATGALSLFWAGLALGRLISARIADRFDHLQFTIVAITTAGIATFAAVLVPSVGASILLFGLVGFASGPVFPMIVAVAGDRFPDRSAAVGGFMAGASVVGSSLYPPIMGFMSVSVGLAAAMLGAGLLSLAGAVSLLAARRLH
ncbi:MAG: MFS transporter [Chloroflexi bacterium]|nr:MFS transporter [Chloroflexota bacterium]